MPNVVRKPLLAAAVQGKEVLDRVEIHEISLGPGQATGLHIHVSPVAGYIVEGSILFQLEGQPARRLQAGEAFFEPANARVAHFDATEGPARFVAFYLLGPGDRELITPLRS
jgi:quercetin dioxygenase-like cupin family protein